jgi:probable F420-dependent oxidoreductase
MMAPRPFRFGTYAQTFRTADDLQAFARKVEALGYSALAVGDHPAFAVGGPLVTLAAVASATTTLRLTAHVFNNDLRHPALLAGELAALDMLSGGRVEIGIGAGWLRRDYDALGLTFDPAVVRVARAEEAVRLVRQLWSTSPTTWSGTHYQVRELALEPELAARPCPLIFIGGGGPRILAFAAREADIIGLDPKGTAGGAKDDATARGDAFATKVAWVREAAGARVDSIEFHVLAIGTRVSDQRQRAAEELAAEWRSYPADIVVNADWDADALLASPNALVGSVDQICADLQERRERFGISYVSIPSSEIDAFAPVVARLAGA